MLVRVKWVNFGDEHVKEDLTRLFTQNECDEPTLIQKNNNTTTRT